MWLLSIKTETAMYRRQTVSLFIVLSRTTLDELIIHLCKDRAPARTKNELFLTVKVFEVVLIGGKREEEHRGGTRRKKFIWAIFIT